MSNTTRVLTSYGDTFPWLLKSKYDAPRLWDLDYPLARDADAYDKMLRDPVIRHALQMRYTIAAGGTWSLIPAREGREEDEAAAAVLTNVLKHIRGFQNRRIQMAQAIFRGASYAKIEGERKTLDIGDDEKPREWWTPTMLRHIDKRFVRRIPKPGAEFDSTMELFSRQKGWVKMPTREFVHVLYDDDQSRLGYGRGLAESVYFYFYAKIRALELGLQGVERWAKGILVAKVDEDRPGDTTQTNENHASGALDVIKKIRSDFGIVIGKDEAVETLETSGQGHQMAIDFVTYCDNAIKVLIAGSLLPAGGGSDKGSLARAEIELEVSDSTSQQDSEILDEAITYDLLPLVWSLNFDNLADLGLADAQCPRFLSQNERVEDTEKNARIASTLLDAGVPLKRQEVYEKTGWTMPGPEDEVIEGRAEMESLLGVGEPIA